MLRKLALRRITNQLVTTKQRERARDDVKSDSLSAAVFKKCR